MALIVYIPYFYFQRRAGSIIHLAACGRIWTQPLHGGDWLHWVVILWLWVVKPF